MDYIKVMGVKIHNTTLDKSLNKVKGFINNEKTNTIYTPNTEIVMKASENPNLRKIINRGDLVIPDGIGIVYASRIRKKPLAERVTGFDLSIKMLELANELGLKLFIVGGKEGVALDASKNINKDYPNIKVVGTNHGFFKGAHIGYENHNEEKKVLDKINKEESDILFVGLGAPKQEIWIDKNKDKLNTKVIIGNGGTIDILAGNVERAPEIFQNIGLEWLYRLMKEPKRIKRQLILPLFAFKVIFSKDKIVE